MEIEMQEVCETSRFRHRPDLGFSIMGRLEHEPFSAGGSTPCPAGQGSASTGLVSEQDELLQSSVWVVPYSAALQEA